MTEEAEQQPIEIRPPNQLDMAFLSALGSVIKWVIASLLFLNGGAMVALLNLEQQGGYLLKGAGAYFVFGAVLAVTCGIMMGVFLMNALDIDIVTSGRSSRRPHERYTPNLLAKTGVFMATFALLGSLGAFLFGAMEVGQALEREERKDRGAAQPSASSSAGL